MSTLRIEHPKGDVVKTIDLPEGTRILVAGMRWSQLPKIDRLEVVVPYDFAATEVLQGEAE